MTSPNSSSPHASRGGQVLVQQGIKKKSVLSVVLVERRWVVISAAALMLLGSTIASPPPPPPPSSGGSSAGGRPFAEPEKTSAELQLLPAIDHQQTIHDDGQPIPKGEMPIATDLYEYSDKLINTIPAILDGHFSPLPFATRRGTHLLAYFTVMDQQQSRMTQVHGYSAEFSMDLASSSGFGEVNVLKSLVTLATHRGHGFDAHFMLFEALKQRTFYEVQPNVIALVLAERDKYTSNKATPICAVDLALVSHLLTMDYDMRNNRLMFSLPGLPLEGQAVTYYDREGHPSKDIASMTDEHRQQLMLDSLHHSSSILDRGEDYERERSSMGLPSSPREMGSSRHRQQVKARLSIRPTTTSTSTSNRSFFGGRGKFLASQGGLSGGRSIKSIGSTVTSSAARPSLFAF